MDSHDVPDDDVQQQQEQQQDEFPEEVEDLEISVNTKKSRRSKFEKACSHCDKVMKSEKLYDKHVSGQVCYSKDEKTICKVCNITLVDRAEYVKHLLSMAHINNIGCNK